MKPPIESFIEAARAANAAAHSTASAQLADLDALDKEAHGQEFPSLNKLDGMIRRAAAAGPAATDRLLEARAALLSLQSETLHSIDDAIAMLQRQRGIVGSWEDDRPGRDLLSVCRGIAVDLAILGAPAGIRPPAASPEELAAAVAPLIENAAANGSKPAFLRAVVAMTAPE